MRKKNSKDVHIRKKLGKLLQSRNIKVRIAKRRRKNNLLRITGSCSIGISLLFLLYIIITLCGNCYNALRTIEVLVPLHIENDARQTITNGIKTILPNNKIENIISGSAHWKLLHFIEEDPQAVGQDIEMWLPASSQFSNIVKHNIPSETKEKIQNMKRLKVSFNTNLFIHADSQYPEYAGIIGAFIGSLFTILTCCICALPIGIMTGVYLHEFKFKNKFLTSIIEVSINNLSATPSIIFGIVGLYFYIQLIGIPRSSALIGGLVLSLMILPVIVISTRQALNSVPNNIKEAAFALGATKMQAMLHHTLPYSFTGIITGTILGIARVLGESAPLLMVGMAAFIANPPHNLLEPATVFPLQIYLWVSNADPTFKELTSILIFILLVILLLLNITATIIRKRMHISTHY